MPVMSNSLQLLCPWNPPGKNTGMDSHSSLQGVFLTQRIKPGSPLLQADSSLSEPPGEALPKTTNGNKFHSIC